MALASCLIPVNYDIEREMGMLSIYILLHYKKWEKLSRV